MPGQPPRSATIVSDRTLVRRLLAGDEEAFVHFFERHFARLYRFALARTDGHADAAEEFVQSTLIGAVRKLHTFRGDSTLFTWMCAICRSEVSSWREATGRRSAVVLLEDVPAIRERLAAVANAADQPDEVYSRRETARLVQVALDALPGRYGDLLEWKYIQGMNVAEISARLRTGPKAVESMLVRARRAFREVFVCLQPNLKIVMPK